MTGKSRSEQVERFEQAARELGVELDEEKLKEALRKIALDRSHEKPHVKPVRDKSGGGAEGDDGGGDDAS